MKKDKKNAFNDKLSKKVYSDGSYNDLQNKLQTAINATIDPIGNKMSYYIQDVIPDQPILNGTVIINNFDSNKNYEIPFTTDNAGLITLGDSTEVTQQTTYVAKSLGFSAKDDAKRLVTGPVMIPGCEDCDFKRGEKVFSVDEVEDLCHKYNTKFRLADQMHVYGSTGEIIGESVENWTTKEDSEIKNINGDTVQLPKGTWMSTTKVNDDDTWQDVQNGKLRGFSGSYLAEKDANKLLEIISSQKSDKTYLENVIAMKNRVLIKDLENPIPVTISLVDSPCVYDAIFTSIKNNPDESFANKAGRVLSAANVKIVQDAKEALNKLWSIVESQNEDDFQSAITNKGIVVNKEEIDMDKSEVEEMIKTSIKDATPEIIKKYKEEADKAGDSATDTVKCPSCGAMNATDAKFCDQCGKSMTATAPKSDPDAPTLESIQKDLEASNKKTEKLEEDLAIANKKLGIDPEAKNLESPEDPDKNKTSVKTNADFMKEAGLKMNGRPLDKE